jgi:hypothetical protein
LADDFKEWNGLSIDREHEGTNKEDYLKSVKFWNEQILYLSIKRQGEAYPDAIEYKDSDDEGLWVQTWDILKGVHEKTGSKINMPMHRLYKINEDNKIEVMIGYYNEEVFGGIGRSLNVRKNGVIYDNHEYINTVKMAVAAYENNDLEKAYSFFAEDARFRGASTMPGDTSATLEELKVSNATFL